MIDREIVSELQFEFRGSDGRDDADRGDRRRRAAHEVSSGK
jgi:hypothetical protein